MKGTVGGGGGWSSQGPACPWHLAVALEVGGRLCGEPGHSGRAQGAGAHRPGAYTCPALGITVALSREPLSGSRK